jgi:hypothetical protein
LHAGGGCVVVVVDVVVEVVEVVVEVVEVVMVDVVATGVSEFCKVMKWLNEYTYTYLGRLLRF